MVPAVAFGHPDDFIRLIEVVREILAILVLVVVDERLALFVDDGAGRARFRIDGDDAQHLMAALVVQKRKAPGIGCPADVLHAPRVGEQIILDRDFLALGHVEKVRFGDGDAVAGLEVVKRV